MNRFFDYGYHVLKLPAIFANQWKDEQPLEKLQNMLLQKLIDHAYMNVPYYRNLFDSTGLCPQDIHSVSDLNKIPVLSKDTILENFPDNIVAKNSDPKHCSRRMTSGSSGKKLDVILDHRVAALYRLMQLRQLCDIGYKPRDKIVYIRYGPPVTKLAIQKFGLLRRFSLPLEWSPEMQLSGILKISPQILNAYPSVLYLLARTVTEEQAAKLDLKFILSNSELLTNTARKTIEHAFQCKVYDDYSCLEFSAIGFECRMQNLHVASDNVIVEIHDEKGRSLPPGGNGKIVITALNNYAMPYIRYEIGDVGTLSQNRCPCGRTFPYFQTMMGRSDDFIVLPNGKFIDPQTVVFQVETIAAVKEFRFFQDVDHGMTVYVVLYENSRIEDVRKQILQNLRAVLSDGIRIDVVQVQSLERGATGKHRSVVSKISAS